MSASLDTEPAAVQGVAWRGDLRMSRIEVVFARWTDSEAALYLGLVPDDSRGMERVIWLQGIGDAVLV